MSYHRKKYKEDYSREGVRQEYERAKEVRKDYQKTMEEQKRLIREHHGLDKKKY